MTEANKPHLALCPHCHRTLKLVNITPGKQYPCPFCGGLIKVSRAPVAEAGPTTESAAAAKVEQDASAITETPNVEIPWPSRRAEMAPIRLDEDSPAESHSSQQNPNRNRAPLQNTSSVMFDIAIVCKVCATRYYGSAAQVGKKLRCPDCFTENEVRAAVAKEVKEQSDNEYIDLADDFKLSDPIEVPKVEPIIRDTPNPYERPRSTGSSVPEHFTVPRDSWENEEVITFQSDSAKESKPIPKAKPVIPSEDSFFEIGEDTGKSTNFGTPSKSKPTQEEAKEPSIPAPPKASRKVDPPTSDTSKQVAPAKAVEAPAKQPAPQPLAKDGSRPPNPSTPAPNTTSQTRIAPDASKPNRADVAKPSSSQAASEKRVSTSTEPGKKAASPPPKQALPEKQAASPPSSLPARSSVVDDIFEDDPKPPPPAAAKPPSPKTKLEPKTTPPAPPDGKKSRWREPTSSELEEDEFVLRDAEERAPATPSIPHDHAVKNIPETIEELSKSDKPPELPLLWHERKGAPSQAKDKEKDPEEDYVEHANELDVFRFLLQFPVLIRWVLTGLVVGLCISRYGLALSDKAGAEFGDSTEEARVTLTWIWLSLVSVSTVAISIAGFVMCLTIFTDTAIGKKTIEQWQPFGILEWLSDSFYVAGALFIACLPGVIVGRLWEGDGGLITLVLGAITAFIVFPPVFVSMLDSGSLMGAFSPKIWNSLTWMLFDWIWFYGLAAAVGVLTLIPQLIPPLLDGQGTSATVIWILNGVAIVVAAFVYFRGLGRLAFLFHVRSADREEAQAKKMSENESKLQTSPANSIQKTSEFSG